LTTRRLLARSEYHFIYGITRTHDQSISRFPLLRNPIYIMRLGLKTSVTTRQFFNIEGVESRRPLLKIFCRKLGSLFTSFVRADGVGREIPAHRRRPN